MPEITTVTPAHVRAMLLARQEVALIDLREEAPFALAHPLFAAQLSAGQIEVEILDRIPRKDVPIVLYDDGEGLVPEAAQRISKLGFSDVRALAGGLAGWRAAGYELFQDVNSYSKAFGELVEHRRHTPSLSAEDVKGLLDAGADVKIMDVRRFDEYATMSIPTGTSVPGAEIVLRARALAPDPATTIVVNCAGRTRSIIGTQSLVNAGVLNPVFALRNGTIGWALAKQALEGGQNRRVDAVPAHLCAEAAQRAREVAYRAGVRRISREEEHQIAADPTRTLYRFDVRSEEEYQAGHIPGWINAPGGQLVQETDMRAPVRGARILLCDDLGSRADMTASWLAQMGWEVYVRDGGLGDDLVTGKQDQTMPPLPDVPTIGVDELAAALDADTAMVIDLATSRLHRQGHIPGARFALPVALAEVLDALEHQRAVVLTSPDGALARFALAGLGSPTGVRALVEGTAAWSKAGRELASGFADALSEPVDIYRRPYEGTDTPVAAMQAYLDWEYGLLEQLALDGTHGFFVI